ncbi:hypothetical protein L7F22_021180 [Adiantum nelumboides]|nr:hypothetical protein [Adiantum nelumboides]
MQHMSNIVSKRVSTMQDNDVWYVDASASNHMTGRGKWFKSMHNIQNAGYVQTGDDAVHPIAHTGDVPLSTRNGKEKYLADVKFNRYGLYVEEYKKNGKLVLQGKKVGRMFTLNVNMPEMYATMFAQGTGVVANVEIWHKRIGHANVQRLKIMQSKELVISLPQFKVFEMQQVCASSQLGKQAKGSFPQERHVSKNLLEVIHFDVWGPAKNTSIGGCRFYVTFIDDCSRKVWVYFMKEKSEVFTHFQNFKAMVKKQTRNFVQCLRSDGGGEYFSNDFGNFLKKHGIQRQFSCRYTLQQNGVAKCKNKHIAEVARALMSEKNMPPCYSPPYCGPFTSLKCIGQVAYMLALPEHSRVHPVFHVSRLHKQLGQNDNVIDTGATDDTSTLVNYLVTRLQQALGNLGLQGLSMVREVENPFQELSQLLEDAPPSKRRNDALPEESPPMERNRSESVIHFYGKCGSMKTLGTKVLNSSKEEEITI